MERKELPDKSKCVKDGIPTKASIPIAKEDVDGVVSADETGLLAVFMVNFFNLSNPSNTNAGKCSNKQPSMINSSRLLRVAKLLGSSRLIAMVSLQTTVNFLVKSEGMTEKLVFSIFELIADKRHLREIPPEYPFRSSIKVSSQSSGASYVEEMIPSLKALLLPPKVTVDNSVINTNIIFLVSFMMMPMMVLRKLKTVLFYDNEDGKNLCFYIYSLLHVSHKIFLRNYDVIIT